MKDHEIRELVNQLRDIAIEYHSAGQLREKITRTVRAAILQAQSDDDGEPTDDERIMAIEGIHNCDRCGDEGWIVGEMGVTRCACGQAGNYPAIPDGYVMVPKEATLEMIKSGASAASNGMLIPGIYKAMLAAAECSIPMISDTWIPVSERMPDENAEQQVLACFKGGDISTLYYFEGRWDDAYGIVPIRQDVTHWMPLPAGPKEVQGE
ncbi:DUF551 domain-containing protein [Klebsiella pneumoniae]